MRSEYDPRTAVTFLLAGVGLGALLALLLSPRHPMIAMSNARREPERPRPESRLSPAV